MKQKVKILGIIVGIVIIIFGGKAAYEGVVASINLRSARSAVDSRNWVKVQTSYQKIQDIKPSIESRTSLQQLEYLVLGDKDSAAGHQEKMKQNYQEALQVDGSMPRINKQIKTVLAEQSDIAVDSNEETSSSSTEKKTSSSSEASVETNWQNASSNGVTNAARVNLANAYNFSDSDVESARSQLKQKFNNVDLYDDTNIKKVMAMSLLNKTSLEVAYQTGGWNN